MARLRLKDRPKRPDAAKNAKPRAVMLTHGANSRLVLNAKLDRRSTGGKLLAAEIAALTAHLGGEAELTPPLHALVKQAGRLGLLEAIAWSELNRAPGLIIDGEAHPAIEVFLKAARDRRAVLQLLGIQRRTKEVPDLQTYLRQKALEADTNE